MRLTALLGVMLLWATDPVFPQTNSNDVRSVLLSMDKLSTGLKTLSFRFRVLSVEGQDAEETERGVVRVAGMGSGNFEALVETDQPANRRIYYRGLDLIFYDPGSKESTEMSLKDYAELVPPLQLLMIGTSGKRVAAAYDISTTGSENIGGAATTKLELVPKSPVVRGYVPKAEIWLPEKGGFPLRLQVNFSGLMRFEFSDVLVNPRFPAGSLRPR